jgi:hypothetical protein
MRTPRSRLDREIAESLASKGRGKLPTYTVQPRNLWRTWDFPTLSEAIAFGDTLREPFDVSTDSGAIVWAWGQRAHATSPSHAVRKRGGQPLVTRHTTNKRGPPLHATRTRHATKKRKKARIVLVKAETPAGYRWLLAHARGATATPEGFVVTDEGEWGQSLAAAGAYEIK